MGMRKDRGRLPLESRPDRLVTAPVSAGAAETVPGQPCGTGVPGGGGEGVDTGWAVVAGAGVGCLAAAPPVAGEWRGWRKWWRWWAALVWPGAGLVLVGCVVGLPA